MPGIAEQAYAVAHDARHGLDDDEGQVERYRHNIYCRQFLYGVRVVVMVVAVMFVLVPVVFVFMEVLMMMLMTMVVLVFHFSVFFSFV